MSLDTAEKWVRRAAALGLVAFFAMIFQGLYRASHRQMGRGSGHVYSFVRRPWSPAIVPMSALGFGVLYLLWRPIRLTLSAPARVAALVAGAAFYFSGLALMLWGRRTLGEMYHLSTSRGAQLYADHRLITSGPFALVRHPMYVGGQLAEIGALLIFRTWATLAVAMNVPALWQRARREEEALAAEFGEQWTEYARRVPAWIPRLRR